METDYEPVIDFLQLLPTGVAVLIHLALAVAQAALAGYLLLTGVFAVARPEPGAVSLRGFQRRDARGTRVAGGLRMALGLLVAAPLLLDAPFLFSVTGCLGALGTLGFLDGRLPETVPRATTRLRRAALVSAAFVAAFLVWEQEDGLALGVHLAVNAQTWRVHELDWQLETDVQAPKVGDLAPDFTLQDPSGEVAVRLSDFRDKRPVALIFGSYT